MADEIVPIDIVEAVAPRAISTLWRFLFSDWRGYSIGLLAVAAGGAAGGTWWDDDIGEVGAVVSGSAAGAGIVALTMFGLFLVLAPRWQRDEARKGLAQIKSARSEYGIEAVEALVKNPLPNRTDWFVDLRVVNRGRPAWFSVVLEDIEGVPFVDAYARLYWRDRHDEDPMEWPRGEERTIGIVTVTPAHGGPILKAMSKDGSRDKGRSYLIESDEPITLWVRITARRDPAVEFYRRFGVMLKRAGALVEIEKLVEDPPFEQSITNLD